MHASSVVRPNIRSHPSPVAEHLNRLLKYVHENLSARFLPTVKYRRKARCFRFI